jgi:Carbohydrate binding domain/Tetratricopeptide repeat
VNLRHTRVARVALALLAIGVCLLVVRDAARIGFSRLLTRYALSTNSLVAADQAVQLTPTDAEAHRARGLILNRLRRPAEAEASLELATTLRDGPEDLWIELGNTREELGDNDGALAAFDQAVRVAPYYAHTHWQRGNLLLRMGRYEEAFADLRQAAAANRKYFSNLLDLAWGLTANAQQTEALVQIRDDVDRLEFARLLARKGKGIDVVDQIRLLGTGLSDENRDELLRLLNASRSSTAEIVGVVIGATKVEQILNSGFEEPLLVNDVMRGWVVSQSRTNPKLAIDVSEKHDGQRSLQVTFAGEWDAGTPLISQTIIVHPGALYSLSFAVKTKDLVTGGPPRIVLTDAKNNQILVKSDPLPSPNAPWLTMIVDFKAQSESVVISLRRDNCNSSQCPIFGTAWLDDFSLQKL